MELAHIGYSDAHLIRPIDLPARDKLGSGMNTTQMVRRYLADRRAADRISNKTMKGYRSVLYGFAGVTPDDPKHINRNHIQRFVDASGIRPTTRRLRLSRCRGLFRWAVLNNHLKRDPTVGVEPPKEPARLPRNLTGAEAAAVLSVAPDARARLAALLMLQEGLRCCEVARLQTGDVDTQARIVAVRGKGGRGDVTRRLPLSDETLRAVADYWQGVYPLAGPLLWNRRKPGVALAPDWIGSIIRQMFRDAGVKQSNYDGKSAHGLRHTAAQDIVDSGANIRTVQHFLGHASVQTTEIYLRGEVEGIREAVSGRNYG